MPVIEDPYKLPPELETLKNLDLPKTDKEAQIIEKTAVFVARQGNQMEIVLKAKQKDNPQFNFLNYDHTLNVFYKGMVKLVREGRYVPRNRQTETAEPIEEQQEPNKSIADDHYELKLPKVDISNTAYASLINRFKKFNEQNVIAKSPSTPTQSEKSPDASEVNEKVEPSDDNTSDAQSPSKQAATDLSVEQNTPNPPPNTLTHPPAVPGKQQSGESESGQKLNVLSPEEYEQYYQEYYKHYYAYYYQQFSQQFVKLNAQTAPTDDQRNNLVQQAAKSAAVAACAAVNAMQRAVAVHNSDSTCMTPQQRSIIDKMARYVARNGREFEALVLKQKRGDPRFIFLQPDHAFNKYYINRRGEEEGNKPDVALSNNDTVVQPPDKSASSEKTLVKEKSSCISFRLSRPNSTAKLLKVKPGISSTQDNGHSTSEPTIGGLESSSSPTSTTPLRESRRKSTRPKFLLPGIPSGSSSECSSTNTSPASSMHSSPIRTEPNHETSRVASPDQTPSLTFYDLITKSPVNEQMNDSMRAREAVLPDTSQANSQPNTISDKLSKSPPKHSLINTIEDMLNIRDPATSSLLNSATITSDDQRLKESRRRRAADLVARLKQSAAGAGSPPIDDQTPSSRRGVPDSVPVAVAQAMVASILNRPSSSSSAKSRKRQPPPSAYANPQMSESKSQKRSSKRTELDNLYQSDEDDQDYSTSRYKRRRDRHS